MTSRTYPGGTVVAIHDGDTCELSIDLGFDLHRTTITRLFGTNAIELADPGGPQVRDHLAELAPIGAPVTVVSHG